MLSEDISKEILTSNKSENILKFLSPDLPNKLGKIGTVYGQF